MLDAKYEPIIRVRDLSMSIAVSLTGKVRRGFHDENGNIMNDFAKI